MTDATKVRWMRHLLLALVFVLTFEGVARKAAPDFMRIPIFFLKDALVGGLWVLVFQMTIPAMLQTIWTGFLVTGVLFVPLIALTAWYDPLLAVFGAKQYLFYPVVGLATFMAFEKSTMDQTFTFYRRISLLVIPTALLAFVQSRLPHDHWLNLSVNGGSMDAFSAGGELRVSSTFSFNAQYSAFLNAETFIVMVALQGWAQRSLFWKLISLTLLPLIVFSSFITGSRGAVVGNLTIVLLAFIISGVKFQVRDVFKIALVALVLFLALQGVRHFMPQALAAYSARENGHLIGISEEIRSRVWNSFVDLWGAGSTNTFLGHGLGVMSNGADVFSYYAGVWRTRLWTETDASTTMFEGGYYLMLVWYGFRFFVVIHTLRHFFTEVKREYSTAMAFCQAFVAISGMLGTLALQPPIAIWWWLGVGTLMLFCWKSIAPPDAEIIVDEPPAPPPAKKIRGRSLYADIIHARK